MLPFMLFIRGGLARLLRNRLVLLALMIGASYLIWGFLHTVPVATAVTSSCAVNSNDYFTTLPNGFGTIIYQNASCQTCHTVEPTRGPFGSDYELQPLRSFPDGSSAHQWNATLAFKDSDGDGYTNGEELQDPTGTWTSGLAGNDNLVSSPNNNAQLPPAPVLNALSGVVSGSTYAGTVNLAVTLNTTIGARKVVYDILNGATVVKSYTKQTDSAANGGYTLTAATFNLAWDSNDVPNGPYTLRATLSDARLAGARMSIQTVSNVTINNPSRILRYVSTSGSDTLPNSSNNDCTNSASPCATIDQAIAQALDNDEIRVAGGTYYPGIGGSYLLISTRVKLIGGYSTGNWSTPDPVAHPTKLDGQNVRTPLLFYVGSDGFALQNVTIQNGNATGGSGGGVILYGAPGTISDVTFDGNSVTQDGGALYLFVAGGTIIQNTSFLNNSAGGAGAAIVADGNGTASAFTASNLLFVNNNAAQGGALMIKSSASATISYATIVGSGPAEAIFLNTGSGPVTLNDTLISGYGTGVKAVNAGINVILNKVLIANDGANNVATPITGGTVSGTPIRGLAGYKNAAAGDYRLAFGAPAIDAGATVAGITTDLDDLTRPFTTPLPNVVLTAPDIGAYEYSTHYGILYFLTAVQNVSLPVQAAHVQVNLTVPSVSPVTVHYATQDSDAKAGVDYTAMSGTLTFPAGDADVTFDIPILATDLTTARSFTVNLSSPTIAQLNLVKSLMITINPPDVSGPPRVVLTARTPNASRDGPIAGVFVLTRDVLLDTALTVNYTVSGSAVAGVDYAALPSSITFQPGQAEVIVKVVPIGGSGDKLVTLTLSPSADYVLGRSSATVSISGTPSWRIYLPLLRH